MKKEVLMIADSDPRKKVIGGIGIYSYNLAKYLTKKGFKVIFIGKKQKEKILNKFNNFKFIELNKKPNQSNYIFLKNLFKIAPKLNLNDDIVINAQRPDWIVPFSKRKNNKIITLHGSHSKNVYLKKGYIIGKIYSRLEKKGLQIADTIISVSEENTKYYKHLYKNYPDIIKKFVTIPVGVDLSKFKGINKHKAREKYGFKKSDKVVVYVGRLEKEKNLPLLIRACHQANLKLFIVGNGREEAHLKNFAQKLHSKTIFHDSVSNEAVPETFACGDIFALTSLYEGLPTVLIEALATGLPIISTEVGDTKKLVIDGKTGFIVNQRNIVEKLRFIIKNPSKYKRNCIEKSKQYSWRKIGDQLMQVLGR